MSHRIAVISHDAAGNAMGRALVLAELLDPLGSVELWAFGREVWRPMRGLRPVHLIPAPRTTVGLLPAARALKAGLMSADILVASKQRILSFGLALAVRGGRPLLLDVDDLEHAFVRRRLGWLRQVVEPDREPVTRLLEAVSRRAVPVTVASRALQRRFGGTWIPHVRDREAFAAQASTRGAAVRDGLGLGASAIIGFIGTPRPHKGLVTAARAVAALNEDAVLLVVGDATEEWRQRLATLAPGRVMISGSLPLEEVPALLGACDVVLVPQGRGLESHFQSPAKLFDAMAAGAPIVASDVGDARDVIGEAGVLVPPDDVIALRDAITHLLSSPAIRRALGASALERYRDEFGLARWRDTMADVVSAARASATRATRVA